KTTITIGGTVRANETWILTLGTAPYSYVAGTAVSGFSGTLLSTDGVAAGLTAAIGTSASVSGSVITVTTATQPNPTTYSITPAPVEASSTASGTPRIGWAQTIQLRTDATVYNNDRWTVPVSGVTPSPFYTAGTTVRGFTGTLLSLNGVAAGLAASIRSSGSSASASGSTVTVTTDPGASPVQ